MLLAFFYYNYYIVFFILKYNIIIEMNGCNYIIIIVLFIYLFLVGIINDDQWLIRRKRDRERERVQSINENNNNNNNNFDLRKLFMLIIFERIIIISLN